MTPQRGFTLIELAIVLVIITILIGGLAVPLSAQIQARRIGETKQTMEEAREAILGYAMTHAVDHDNDPGTPPLPFLPCPDTPPFDGRENRTAGTCDARFGLLPWVDLGTAPQDAWGNRLRYAVVPQFASAAFGGGFSNDTPLPAPLNVCTSHTCIAPGDVAGNVVFVLVSHGPNGWGASNINGNTLSNPSGDDELDNLDPNRIYVSRAPTKPGAANGEFDDLVTWLSRDRLIAQLCPPGSDCNP